MSKMAKTAAPDGVDDSGDTFENNNMDSMSGEGEVDQIGGDRAEDVTGAIDDDQGYEDPDTYDEDDAEGADKDDGTGIEQQGDPASGLDGEEGEDGNKPDDT
jgi:hypothetical protein